MASTPVDIASALLQRATAADTANNLSAQAHARNVLFEVQEQPENFPSFDGDLDERVAALAYAFLHAGCTLSEGITPDLIVGPAVFTAAADHSHTAPGAGIQIKEEALRCGNLSAEIAWLPGRGPVG